MTLVSTCGFKYCAPRDAAATNTTCCVRLHEYDSFLDDVHGAFLRSSAGITYQGVFYAFLLCCVAVYYLPDMILFYVLGFREADKPPGPLGQNSPPLDGTTFAAMVTRQQLLFRRRQEFENGGIEPYRHDDGPDILGRPGPAARGTVDGGSGSESKGSDEGMVGDTDGGVSPRTAVRRASPTGTNSGQVRVVPEVAGSPL